MFNFIQFRYYFLQIHEVLFYCIAPTGQAITQTLQLLQVSLFIRALPLSILITSNGQIVIHASQAMHSSVFTIGNPIPLIIQFVYKPFHASPSNCKKVAFSSSFIILTMYSNFKPIVSIGSEIEEISWSAIGIPGNGKTNVRITES